MDIAPEGEELASDRISKACYESKGKEHDSDTKGCCHDGEPDDERGERSLLADEIATCYEEWEVQVRVLKKVIVTKIGGA